MTEDFSNETDRADDQKERIPAPMLPSVIVLAGVIAGTFGYLSAGLIAPVAAAPVALVLGGLAVLRAIDVGFSDE